MTSLVSRQSLTPAAIGAGSGLFYLLAVSGGIPGILPIYVPLVALLYAGFAYGWQACVLATAAAAVVLTLSHPAALMSFLVLEAVPVLLFVHWYHRRVATLIVQMDASGVRLPDDPGPHSAATTPTQGTARDPVRDARMGAVQPGWYPVSTIMLWLTLYAGAILILTDSLLRQRESSLRQIIAEFVEGIAGRMPGPQAEALGGIMAQWGFILPATAVWLWLGMILLTAMLVQFLWTGTSGYRAAVQDAEASNSVRPRASVRIDRTMYPLWLPLALALAALASSTLSGDAQYLTKALFIVMLFPYFLTGMHLVHLVAEFARSRTLILVALYGALALALFPAALCLAFGGVAYHLFVLSKLLNVRSGK